MRLLHVLNELRDSGAEVMLRVAGPIWREHGLDLHVVSIGPEVGQFAETLSAAGYEVHHHPLHASSLPAFRRFLRACSFDVVHTHPEYANFWVCSTARISGVRTVVRTVHSVFDFSGPLRAERTAQRWALRRLGVKMVSVGESVLENERNQFLNRTYHVPNWIDTDLFQPMPHSDRHRVRRRLGIQSGPVLVSVGNCGPAKNHGMLLEALTRLTHERKWTYLHIGEEEPGQPERRLAQRLGVSSRMRFLGRRAADHTAEIVGAADIFVMPSRYEGQSLAVIEGLSAGLLTVLTDVPGLRDLRGTTANVLWAQLTVADLARVLEQALTRATSRTDQDRFQSHEGMRERFNVEVGAGEYAKLYGAGARRARRPGSRSGIQS